MTTGAKFEIRHRHTGAVLFSGDGLLCDADLCGAYLQYADLCGADLRGADLRGANLKYADLIGAYLKYADLAGTDLAGADLRGANLKYADLIGAYLKYADLAGTDLAGADLRGADLRSTCVIGLGQRSDGHQFFFHMKDDGEPWVLAGCRYFPLSDARAHWDDTRPAGTPLGDETRAILDHGERLMVIRGLTQ